MTEQRRPLEHRRLLILVVAREERPDVALLDVELGDEVVYPLADVLIILEVPVVFAKAYG